MRSAWYRVRFALFPVKHNPDDCKGCENVSSSFPDTGQVPLSVFPSHKWILVHLYRV